MSFKADCFVQKWWYLGGKKIESCFSKVLVILISLCYFETLLRIYGCNPDKCQLLITWQWFND